MPSMVRIAGYVAANSQSLFRIIYIMLNYILEKLAWHPWLSECSYVDGVLLRKVAPTMDVILCRTYIFADLARPADY